MRDVTVSRTIADSQGNQVVASKTFQVGTPLLVGMSAPNGAATRAIVTDYPGIKYMREFGSDSADADTLPELNALTAGKWPDLPAGAIMHASWKDDVEQLSTWLNGINQPIYLTWYHEPMGDVVPATYRTTAARITQILATHPKRNWVVGHGPIVTRYWLDEGGGSPLDWGYTGMTHYGIDCYMNVPTASSYFTTTKMFKTVFDKVRAAYPGVRLLVPEYGVARISSDGTGAGRAQAIRDHILWLRTQPDVDAVCYWNNWAEYEISPYPLEKQAWRDMQAL